MISIWQLARIDKVQGSLSYFAREKGGLRAALVAEGRPVKPVCQAVGVARSHVIELMTRSPDWVDGRKVRQIDVLADLALVDAVRAEIGQLPTYGYRRAVALVNRRRMAAGLALLHHKRFYRVMKAYRLLLPKAPKRIVSARVHNGTVAVQESNRRWSNLDSSLRITCIF